MFQGKVCLALIFFFLLQACHARISTSSAQLGLTELQYGILPGLGGTIGKYHSLSTMILFA